MVWQSGELCAAYWRAGRTAIAPVLKTGARKGLGVRIPRSPLEVTVREKLPGFGSWGFSARGRRLLYEFTTRQRLYEP